MKEFELTSTNMTRSCNVDMKRACTWSLDVNTKDGLHRIGPPRSSMTFNDMIIECGHERSTWSLNVSMKEVELALDRPSGTRDGRSTK